MAGFRTQKGTELPLLNLKGKEYLQVAHRLVWFREEHPLGCIESECVEKNEKYVVYKASISVASQGGSYVKLADAVKREDYSHFPDAHEKAQTGAIGRALAMCGFGTQFAPEFDEGDRIVDAPVDSKKNMSKEMAHGNSGGNSNHSQGSGYNSNKAPVRGSGGYNGSGASANNVHPKPGSTGHGKSGPGANTGPSPNGDKERDSSNPLDAKRAPHPMQGASSGSSSTGDRQSASGPTGEVQHSSASKEVRGGLSKPLANEQGPVGSDGKDAKGNSGKSPEGASQSSGGRTAHDLEEATRFCNEVLSALRRAESMTKLIYVWSEHKKAVSKLPPKEMNMLILAKEELKKQFS